MNCGLYHNIKSAFNRVYILFPVNGWGCQYTASSVVEIMHGEGTPYSSSLNGKAFMLFMPRIAVACSKIFQGLCGQIVH